tara:strand:+ start:513 stop:1487 length:975 start_codon:yes stop_codon:yes gene_type:complete
MKKIFMLLALISAFTMNAQISTNGTNNSGTYSSALGYQTTASGNYSTAMGYQTTAGESYCTAMGYATTASGSTSTSMGVNTTASGDGSTAMGNLTVAIGNNSTAMGVVTTASGDGSTSMGLSTMANGNNSTAMGISTTASGDNSTAMGKSTVASDYASLVIGQHNFSGSSVTNSATSFSASNTAFVIGNGNSVNLSDAFKVLFNGDATIGNNLTVLGDVEIQSDERLKSNIESLGSTLNKLLQLDGKSYELKGKQKIGVLAQDIQEVFPELVSKDEREILAVNYQGLIPVLINAMKDQQGKIEKYQNEVIELKAMVQKLMKRNK